MPLPDAPSPARPTRVRQWLIALIFVVTTINYASRATFSIAGSGAAADLGLSPVAVGYVLSAFAWAYVAAQLPGGLLLDRFGTRRVYLGAIVLWSIFTAAQALVGHAPGFSAFATLVALRLLVGMAEAPSFPGNARLVAAWFPAGERGAASAVFNSAQYFSLVAFAPLMGWVVHAHGWRAVFWVMGALGLASAALFASYVRSPLAHPGVNAAELALIREGGGLVALDHDAASAPPRWRDLASLLSHRMLIGIYLGQYCINVLTYFFVTWFPIYLVKERGLDILQAGFAAAVPALCGFVGGLAGGFLSDAILRRTGSVDRARKGPLVAGMLLASVIMVCVFVRSDWLVVVLMSVAFFGKGVASLGWAVMADVAPRRQAGMASAVFNMFGNVAGIVTPIAIGYIVATTGSFDGALIFVGVHCLLTIVAFVVVAGPLRRLEID